jgi:hypothetical protein
MIRRRRQAVQIDPVIESGRLYGGGIISSVVVLSTKLDASARCVGSFDGSPRKTCKLCRSQQDKHEEWQGKCKFH